MDPHAPSGDPLHGAVPEHVLNELSQVQATLLLHPTMSFE
jgi:hypothetical protein